MIVPFLFSQYSILGLFVEQPSASIQISLFQVWICSASSMKVQTCNHRTDPFMTTSVSQKTRELFGMFWKWQSLMCFAVARMFSNFRWLNPLEENAGISASLYTPCVCARGRPRSSKLKRKHRSRIVVFNNLCGNKWSCALFNPSSDINQRLNFQDCRDGTTFTTLPTDSNTSISVTSQIFTWSWRTACTWLFWHILSVRKTLVINFWRLVTCSGLLACTNTKEHWLVKRWHTNRE